MNQLPLFAAAVQPTADVLYRRYGGRPGQRNYCAIKAAFIDGLWHYGLDIMLALQGEFFGPMPKWHRGSMDMDTCLTDARQALSEKLTAIVNGRNTHDGDRITAKRLLMLVENDDYSEMEKAA